MGCHEQNFARSERGKPFIFGRMKNSLWLFVGAMVFAFVFPGSIWASTLDKDAVPDVLPVHSKWEGTEEANASHADSHDRHCTLTITGRNRDQFKALYAVGTKGDKLRVEGEIKDDGTFTCIPVEVMHGEWGKDILKDHWNGKIDGDKLVIERWISSEGGTKKTELKRKGSEKS